ncbi:elongation factor EF-Ts [Candidatus Hodgkinia cicadicola]|nr:elongation factor EF-Ts [Candidatus Hodgkinia cicadicola]
MVSGLYKIKWLRKLTNMGVMKCRQVLDECHGDLDEALKRVYIINSRSSNAFEGDLYLACIRTRLGVCLFRVYANANIYNNKFVWRLRQLLNQTLCNLQFDLETVLNIKQIEGILVHSCVLLRFNANVYSVYFHNKVCDFVYKKGVLVMLSALGCSFGFVNWLGVELSKQALFSVCVNGVKTLENLLSCEYICDSEYNVKQFIDLFQSKLDCVVSLNCILIIC